MITLKEKRLKITKKISKLLKLQVTKFQTEIKLFQEYFKHSLAKVQTKGQRNDHAKGKMLDNITTEVVSDRFSNCNFFRKGCKPIVAKCQIAIIRMF